jgi:predicted RNase H-like HicB family nuclease
VAAFGVPRLRAFGYHPSMRNEFTAIIGPAEEGGYRAYCLEVEGANGQGETVDEVLEDLEAAIELMLEVSG